MKSESYPELLAVNVADSWRERFILTRGGLTDMESLGTEHGVKLAVRSQQKP
jgi:hypothetical protein